MHQLVQDGRDGELIVSAGPDQIADIVERIAVAALHTVRQRAVVVRVEIGDRAIAPEADHAVSERVQIGHGALDHVPDLGMTEGREVPPVIGCAGGENQVPEVHLRAVHLVPGTVLEHGLPFHVVGDPVVCSSNCSTMASLAARASC